MKPLPKDAIIGFIALAIILIGIIWFAVAHQPATTPPPVTTIPDGSGQTVAKAAHITDAGQYYTVDTQYPSQTALAGLPDSADVNAVALMKQWEMDTIAEFKTSFTDLDADYAKHLDEEGLKGSLTIEYKTYSGTNTVSYSYLIYENTLGAHPNTFYKTFTFDTRDGRNLGLSDLFTQQSTYLPFLSSYTREKLLPMIAAREEVDPSEVDTSMLNEGTTPQKESFADFYFTGHTFVLLFPPYAVGPYVLGGLELDIPTSAVTGLKADYQ